MKTVYITGYVIHRTETGESMPVVGPIRLTEALLVQQKLEANDNFVVELGSEIKIQKKKRACNKIDILTIIK